MRGRGVARFTRPIIAKKLHENMEKAKSRTVARCLGSYELVERLGEGGMAQVWRGVRRVRFAGACKSVAIKLIAEHLARRPQYRRSLLREARLAMLLSHSNIVQVFDVGEAAGELYMVMEWVDGLSLHELVRELGERGRRLDDRCAMFIAAELLKALIHAHEHQPSAIVHRDISPQNVMISRFGEVKLTDFGIGRLVAEDTSGVIKGKLEYMAPEQLRGAAGSPSVDLFALGAVLFELLEGRAFRSAADQAELYGLAARGEHARATREDLPDVPAAILRGLLQPDPRARIRSARAALERIHAWDDFRDATLTLAELVRGLERGGDPGAQTDPELRVAALPKLVGEFAGERGAGLLAGLADPRPRGAGLLTRVLATLGVLWIGGELRGHTHACCGHEAVAPRRPVVVELAARDCEPDAELGPAAGPCWDLTVRDGADGTRVAAAAPTRVRATASGSAGPGCSCSDRPRGSSPRARRSSGRRRAGAR